MFGGRHGNGVLTVRDASGRFSNPVFISLTGGSFGWQIGAQSTDVVLVFATQAQRREVRARQLHAGRQRLGGGRAGRPRRARPRPASRPRSIPTRARAACSPAWRSTAPLLKFDSKANRQLLRPLRRQHREDHQRAGAQGLRIGAALPRRDCDLGQRDRQPARAAAGTAGGPARRRGASCSARLRRADLSDGRPASGRRAALKLRTRPIPGGRQERKNARSARSVSSGLSSGMKCPQSIASPIGAATRSCQVSSGRNSLPTTPRAPQRISVGQVTLRPALTSARSLARSRVHRRDSPHRPHGCLRAFQSCAGTRRSSRR